MKKLRPSGGRCLGKQDRRQLRVLYQDDAVVVLNKPAKMLAVPTDDSDLPSALSLLSAELNSKRQRAFVVSSIASSCCNTRSVEFSISMDICYRMLDAPR